MSENEYTLEHCYELTCGKHGATLESITPEILAKSYQYLDEYLQNEYLAAFRIESIDSRR